MYADGVEVFHVTDGYRGIVGVAHDFVLYLFVALYALFNEDLMYGRKRKRVFDYLEELLFVVRETAARAAQRKCGSEHYGITDIRNCFESFFYRICYL